MEYTKLDDPEGIAKETLRQQAGTKEELAFQEECTVAEMEAAASENPSLLPEVEQRKLSAAAMRKEADAYIKAADLKVDEIIGIHKGFLHRWIEGIERSHIAHNAILSVKRDLDQPTADHDSVLAALERSHDLAIAKLSETENPPAKARAAKKS